MVSFPPFRLDVDEERLWRGPKQVPIRRKPFAILAYLVANPKRLVTHDELMKGVWGDVTVSESAIRTHLHELRQILGEGLIETVIGRGYRFTGEPARATTIEPPPIATAPEIVGRADELAVLRGALAKAESGQRQLCFVVGEPGIGKTTLVEAFVDSLAEGVVASGQCIEQHGTAEPYMPVIQMFAQLRKAEETAAETLAMLMRHAPTFLAQMPHLVPDGQFEDVLRRARGGTEARMVRELFEAIEALSAERTLVIVLEDIQWADLATLDLISALGQRRERARLLVVATSRVAEASTPSHPVNRAMRPMIARNGAIQIDVERIAARDVADLLAHRFPTNAFPPGLAVTIDRMTAGIPLFVAAVVDDLVARAMIAERDGTWQLVATLEQIAAHRADSVRQLIDIQLDRLAPEEQRVLEAASLLGTGGVSTALVAAALELSVEATDDLCDGLAHRSLFLRRDQPAEWPDGGLDTRYVFTHGLVQEVCERRVSPTRVQRWQRQIGERMEAAWGDRAEEVAVALANHFKGALLATRAVRYFVLAAERAQRRYATADALVLRRAALDLLPRITDASRDELELRILVGMTPAVLRIHDEFVRDPAATFGRRLELARRLGDPSQICAALMDFAFYHTLNANHFAAGSYLEQIDELLATTTVPPAVLAQIDSARAVDYMWRGRLREARALFERLAEEGEAAIIAVGDRRILMRTYLSIACYVSGSPDRALREIQRCVALATEVGDPYTLGLALATHAAVHFMRRDPPAIIDATAARVLANPETLPWHAPAALLRTWVRSQTTPLDAAEADAMIVDFRRRLAKFPLGASTLASRVIGALASSPRVAEARVLLEEMFEFPKSRGEELFASELLTMQANLTEESALAAPIYREAIARARTNGSKSFELRAALHLAQRCGDTSALASALEGFEDGADTLDQIEARALLGHRDS